MKVAIVSPLPPDPTGIADYTMDVSHALATNHSVDFFYDGTLSQKRPSRSRPHEELRGVAGHYDAIVYQVGNGPAHDFQYAAMRDLPGAVVLHDLVLHHARSRIYLESNAARAYAADRSNAAKRSAALAEINRYTAEADAAYPEAGERLLDAHLNTAGDLLLFAYPFFQEAIRHARALGAHNAFMVDAVREELSRLKLPASVTRVVMPVTRQAVDETRSRQLRDALGVSAETTVVGCFGLVTREKRIESVARAAARLRSLGRDLHLVLVGPVADAGWLTAVLERTGLQDVTTVTGRVEMTDFLAYMDVADIVAHLRYPTARETSAALLRVLAQGRPTVIADLANQAEVPENAVMRVDLADEEGGMAHSLLALIESPVRARRLGAEAASFVEREHSPGACASSYETLIDLARAT